MIHILAETVRGVVFQLGRCVGVKGPGLVFTVPFVQALVRVNMAPQVLELPQLAITSRDGERIKVDAAVTFQVLDPVKALSEVADYARGVAQLAEVTLRGVLSRHTVNEIYEGPEEFAAQALGDLDPETANWGLKVTGLDITHVDLGVALTRKRSASPA